MIVFSWVVGAFFELAIGGLTLEECLRNRTVVMLPNFLTSGLFGMYRAWMVHTFAPHGGRLRVGVIDIFVFATTQVPQYIVMSWLNGIAWEKIQPVVVSLLILSLQIGWLAGLNTEQFRRWFGIPPTATSPS